MEQFAQWPLHGQIFFTLLLLPGAIGLLFMLVAYPWVLIRMAIGKDANKKMISLEWSCDRITQKDEGE